MDLTINMKNKAKKIVIGGGILILVILFSICCWFIPLPKASKIFKDNLYSVVEIKAVAEGVGESFGTAEFIDEKGTLITNAHIVTYSRFDMTYTFDEYAIRFAMEEIYREVELIKYDIELDIAVLRLKEIDLEFRSIKLGSSKKLQSGDTVYAIGNAINHGLSMSKGMVGIPVVIMEYSGYTKTVIQCDLTIAEGNSGGVLLDERGKVVGITTFRTKDTEGNVGYGLAYCIPIDIIMEYIESQNLN